MLEKIAKGNYEATRTDDPAIDGYYIDEWISHVYIYQEDIVMKGCNPPKYVYTREMVCQARFWNPVGKVKYWYTVMPKREEETTLRMNQILIADITLIRTTKDNKLSKGHNKRKVEELGAVRIREEGIDELLEGIRRRDQFGEEFDIDNDET